MLENLTESEKVKLLSERYHNIARIYYDNSINNKIKTIKDIERLQDEMNEAFNHANALLEILK
jgi:3-isopropylmalate dehydratase small subunit